MATDRIRPSVELVAYALDAVGDHPAGALLVQAGGDQLLGGAHGGVRGEAPDFVEGGGLGLGDLFLGGGSPARDLRFQGSARVFLELGGFGGGGIHDAAGFGFGAGGALLVVGEQGGSLDAQALGLFQLGGDHRGALVQHLADHARNALPEQQGADKHEADGNPGFGIVEDYH